MVYSLQFNIPIKISKTSLQIICLPLNYIKSAVLIYPYINIDIIVIIKTDSLSCVAEKNNSANKKTFPP
ncbi:MAG: hypothetical protein A2626_01765 [Candidatus Nealsonbacteria bacterium RIFCSPHIGHO2_01_FULL_38_55]|uniref:Uncharacterized protein n=1 Tax=Candidatus Nealsonbacteria bacterium RIFCSPHIGHO2_01_FULL_38_55 TaxID=1801664 RepID=A0A1G2E270_9BACT|nr:MAG: hypothetical protein A2626_01765 [Candidatus Nealsonbacteria bacterium RIFCSPHIGHO2_01_FULL_38_55]OGZ21125.1 MAG: hypothetical protein A3C48_01970 [Candidatus Nealsonbacteria bacterium RIFCSPHIGHO2_02_FULL_38_75]OGZ22941.1 MAG: hypothetical protein A2981_02640 [Candidatus Nealsonbacteria bacterium RIFCSPLOWO2_01_FULL_38_120]OGZ25842.1 MAG: hypothetical protein A3I85_01090 [Candidatus Nealsonbacteria bacterium RIFCSPLOWO2_02_FULL_38_63]